jgi:hypothetical protein
MKNWFSLLLVAFAFMFCGCGVHWDELLNSTRLEDELKGLIPSSVIPDAIRSSFESTMPIHEGTTPPDIKGEYVRNQSILVGSSLSFDADGIGSRYPTYSNSPWADLYIAFIEGSKDGTLLYRERENSNYSGSEDITLEVVGKGDEFSAYFVQEGTTRYETEERPECNYSIRKKQSTIISGIWTSEGIRNLHYSFVILEKGPDPEHCMMQVNDYRTFKDGDGLAENFNWYQQ